MLFVTETLSAGKLMHIRAVMMKFSRYLLTRIYALIFNYRSMYVTALVGNNYGRLKTNHLWQELSPFNPSSILTKTPKSVLYLSPRLKRGKRSSTCIKRLWSKFISGFWMCIINLTETVVFCITSNPTFTKIRYLNLMLFFHTLICFRTHNKLLYWLVSAGSKWARLISKVFIRLEQRDKNALVEGICD